MCNLGEFVTSPSLVMLSSCQKQDLVEIMAHFGILVSKQLLKHELRALVVDGLVNLGVLASVAEAAVGQPDVQPTVPVLLGTPLSGRAVDEDEGKVVL